MYMKNNKYIEIETKPKSERVVIPLFNMFN